VDYIFEDSVAMRSDTCNVIFAGEQGCPKLIYVVRSAINFQRGGMFIIYNSQDPLRSWGQCCGIRCIVSLSCRFCRHIFASDQVFMCSRSQAHASRIIVLYGSEYKPDWVNDTCASPPPPPFLRTPLLLHIFSFSVQWIDR
jgi:hypothetical protein